MRSAPFALPLLLLASGSLPAQVGEAPQDPASDYLLDRELERWRAAHGSGWRAQTDPDTNRPVLLFGASAEPAREPRGSAEFIAAARDFASAAEALLGISPASLVRPSYSDLPLSFGGSSDKVAVRFEQQFGALPVFGGSFNVLMDRRGRLLSVHNRALSGAAPEDLQPTLDEAAVRRIAAGLFLEATGLPVTQFTRVRLGIEPERNQRQLAGTLAFELELRHDSPGKVNAKRFVIAAQGEPRLLRSDELIHFAFDVGGNVRTLATPGSQPDSGTNPPTSAPAAYLRVSSSAGTTTTDASGNFNFPGVNGPLAVTFTYVGPFNDVNNVTGSDYSLTTSLSGTNNNVLLNPAPNGPITAQANIFQAINLMRDWIRGIDASDLEMDLVNTAFANRDFVDLGGGFVIDDCNAYYDGSSTNYFLPGGGCVNTAYSTVVAHEQGHWLNDRYGSGNGSDGFGEGNADVFAMYLYDTPIVGAGFFGPGTQIRSGLNTTPFCGDTNPGCHGGVHASGQVLGGALWKTRANLQAKYGGALGGLVADQLLSGWMNGFDQGTITTAVEIQWLTLDDNDGNIGNGTPNYAEIDAAFRAQGFPGFELELISIDGLVKPADTLDQVGPYGVAANLAAQQGSLTQARVFYGTGAGFQSVPMALYQGSQWAGLIPGIAAPAEVRWYIEASDSLGNVVRFPKTAPAAFEVFRVGALQTFFSEGFEGPSDNGWTTVQLATQNDWQRGVPQGKGGSSQGIGWIDPSAAASGQNAWGNDLGIGNFNGAYQPNVENALRSPAINLSGAFGVTLRFKRWLTVEQGIYDQATIRVNGTTVWSNPLNQNLLDTAWVDFQLPVPQASGNPAAQFEFRLKSDGGLNLGGWAIDDFQLFSLSAPSLVGVPTAYGAGLAGLGGLVPLLDSAGQPAKQGNALFRLVVKNGRPGAGAIVGLGTQSLSLPVFGGTLLILPTLTTSVQLDAFGQAVLPFPLAPNPALVGLQLFAQAFVSDAAAPQGFAMSRGLAIQIVN
jgi:hypothetical protein